MVVPGKMANASNFHLIQVLKNETHLYMFIIKKRIYRINVSNITFNYSRKKRHCWWLGTLRTNTIVNGLVVFQITPRTCSYRQERVNPSPAVLLFDPKYRVCHPENYLFLLSKKNIFWVKVSQKKMIWFWKQKHYSPVACCLGRTACMSLRQRGTVPVAQRGRHHTRGQLQSLCQSCLEIGFRHRQSPLEACPSAVWYGSAVHRSSSEYQCCRFSRNIA